MALTNEDRKLAFTPAYELVQMIKSRRISPVELMGAVLRRVEELNPRLNAYLTVAGDKAIQAAQQSEVALTRGENLGPLHGLPISIKDLFNTKGLRTTYGSLIYKDFVPDEEGTTVSRLKAAGAIIVGKTNTPEFGQSGSTDNKLGDDCRNPWNTKRSSGGSSGGAAASVAAGMGPLALGADDGGSARIPASCCGVYGLKPTNGRVPYDFAPGNVIPDYANFGTIARNVKDAALMMNVISGPDGVDYTCLRSAPPDFVKALQGKSRKLKIAWSPDLGYAEVDPEVESIAETAAHAFEELGHEVEEATPAIGSSLLGSVFHTWEAAAAIDWGVLFGSLLDEHADELMPYNKSCLEWARKVSGLEVASGWIEVRKWRGAMLDFFAKYDLLLTPTNSVPAWPVGEKGKKAGNGFIDWSLFPLTLVFNLTHNPAATVPCGFSSDGLPIGIQIVGRLEDEATVLQASAEFEKARPWADKRPPVS